MPSVSSVGSLSSQVKIRNMVFISNHYINCEFSNKCEEFFWNFLGVFVERWTKTQHVIRMTFLENQWHKIVLEWNIEWDILHLVFSYWNLPCAAYYPEIESPKNEPQLAISALPSFSSSTIQSRLDRPLVHMKYSAANYWKFSTATP